jgi:hypothetical protein
LGAPLPPSTSEPTSPNIERVTAAGSHCFIVRAPLPAAEALPIFYADILKILENMYIPTPFSATVPNKVFKYFVIRRMLKKKRI